MDTQTLKNDIDSVVSVLKAIESIAPNATNLQTYTDILAGIVEQPLMLAFLCAWINTLATNQPVPAPTKKD